MSRNFSIFDVRQMFRAAPRARGPSVSVYVLAEPEGATEANVAAEVFLDVLRTSPSSPHSSLAPAGCFRFAAPQGGYFVWVQIPAHLEAASLLALAEARHSSAHATITNKTCDQRHAVTRPQQASP